ncbi:MAG TPA: cupin domain-containing protein [Burkholderiaceae bacterium]|mgnify:CR=1 FL=1|nr:cupin domain-containing protein [Burkholderiaceae bacterium]
MSGVRKFNPDAAGDFRWETVDRLKYKEDGSAPFKDITRQVLFSQPDQASELRYFEVSPGGHSTLERHVHTHAVLILRGRGSVRLGQAVQTIAERDLVTIDPMTWHQFHADSDCALGFLCLVSKERDKPQLPTSEQAAQLLSDRP